MSNPEQGPQQQGIVGNWQTVSLQAPDFLEPIREGVDSFFGLLVNTLTILSNILEVAKVFANGLLDPQIALIKALIDQIKNLLNDLRQAGVYAHGDFYILEGPNFDSLRGGFRAYEQRMISRLLDSSDPNRPNFSESTSVFAVFLYSGADATGVENLVTLVRNLLNLFNRQAPVARLQNQAYNVRATYGYDGATIFSFNKSFFRGFVPRPNENAANPYNAVNLTWEMAPLPGPKFPAAPIVPPTGFLVEFSTLADPLPVFYDRPIQGALETLETSNASSKRDVGQCIDEDGNPVYLTSGLDQISIQDGLDFNDALTVTGELKPDAVRVFSGKTIADVAPIQISDLREGDQYFIQRAFYVPAFQGAFFSGKKYGATFTYDKMPLSAEWKLNGKRVQRTNEKPTDKFFVRVRAVSGKVNNPRDVQYLVDQASLRDRNGPILPLTLGYTLADRGPSSEVVPILFPDVSTETWLRLVAESLAILVLSRSDLSVLRGLTGPLDFPPRSEQQLLNGTVPTQWGQYQNTARLETGLEELATFILPQLIGNQNPRKYYEESNVSPSSFRRSLFIACINLTNRLFSQNTPPLSTRLYAISKSEELANFRIEFDDSIEIHTALNSPGSSILEILTQDNTGFGLALNPNSLGVFGEREGDLARFSVQTDLLSRYPHFFEARRGPLVLGSADSSPVAYRRSGPRVREIVFVRNLIPAEVYEQARFVLSLAVGPQVRPQERGWIAFRLFPQGIPDIDRFFDQIVALLESIQAALEAAAETIRRYIEYLQSRIRELQAFLNEINAQIQRYLRLFFAITPAAGLVVVAPGTEGIVQSLVSAQNKPQSGPGEFGAGVVLVAGGLPTFALEIFQNLFSGDG